MTGRASRTLAEWLSWQESLHPSAIELGLQRVAAVARRLGLPDVRIRTLTVAGTNGKGSSSTLAAGIYRAAGYHVGLYTSPHLQRYNERVVIDGVQATDADLCRAFEAVDQARGDTSLTYFEFGTLAALWLFREAQLDVQVLEVGLGGRLDAVNLVDADASLITNIGLDHLEWLGPDRETIGLEKAGILRTGRPAIYADPAPVASVRQAAQSHAVPLQVLDEDFCYRMAAGCWHWQGRLWRFADLPLPGLRGETQVRNAAGVLAAVEALSELLPVAEAAIRTALPALTLPGRCQHIGRLIVDVAHNAEAAAVLAEHLREQTIEGHTFLIVAMLSDKPVEAFIRMLQPLVTEVGVAALPGPRGLSERVLQDRLAGIGIRATAYPDVASSVSAVRCRMRSEDRLVVTGSFLTVAAALDCWHE